MAKLKALLIDLSGTLHVGNEATTNAVEALRRLRAAGVPVRSCSNTTKDGSKALLQRLQNLNLDIQSHEIYTSLSAVRSLVIQRRLRPLLLLSHSALEDFADVSTSNTNAVVIGLAPEKLDYANLNTAFRLLNDKSEKRSLIATHKAAYFKESDGQLSLGPGGFVSALEQACDIQAEVVGKPSRSFFEICLRSLEDDGIKQEDWASVGIVGDDVSNDLGGGAVELGLRRYLVKTGKYREGDERKASAGETIRCFETFADVVDHVLGA